MSDSSPAITGTSESLEVRSGPNVRDGHITVARGRIELDAGGTVASLNRTGMRLSAGASATFGDTAVAAGKFRWSRPGYSFPIALVGVPDGDQAMLSATVTQVGTEPGELIHSNVVFAASVEGERARPSVSASDDNLRVYLDEHFVEHTEFAAYYQYAITVRTAFSDTRVMYQLTFTTEGNASVQPVDGILALTLNDWARVE